MNIGIKVMITLSLKGEKICRKIVDALKIIGT